MTEQEPNDKSQAQEPIGNAVPIPTRRHRSRRRSLTPEQRRLLGTPRSLHDETAEQSDVASPDANVDSGSHGEGHGFGSEERKRAPLVAVRRQDDKSFRTVEMQQAALIIGTLFVLGLTFYVGRKFDYWRFLLMSRHKPGITEKIPNKFSSSSADELVEQALVAERANNWRDATERLMAAKDKNPKYRGILLRAGKIAYDREDFDTAEKLFERAVRLGENVGAANYYRGLLATRRHDLPAAFRFFEAAANEDPFTPDYYFGWAEALRMDHHPQEAIQRYEQAERRARGDQDAKVCQFKMRMARLEAGETDKLKAEIEKNTNSATPALDRSLTAAALAIREGRIEDAVRNLAEARAISERTANGSAIFASCTGDTIFQDACRKYRELAEVCQTSGPSASTLP